MNYFDTQRYTPPQLFLLVGFLVLISLFPMISHGQIIPQIQSVLVPEILPTHPAPGERVNVSIESFSIDLSTSNISWFLNDRLQQQSVGATTFSFTTGNLGSTSVVDVIAETVDGGVFSEQVIIRPTDVDILWQADASAHPLYKGKVIPAVENIIQVEAVPHFISGGGRISRDALNYTWRVDGKVVERVSGVGRYTMTVAETRPIDALRLEVEVAAFGGTLLGKESIQIPIESPEILVYENNPLLGILFNRAIRNVYTLLEGETKLIAYPFSFSLNDRNDEHIRYSWQLDGDQVTLGDDRGSVTVSYQGGEAGEVDMSVRIRNARDIFQEASSEFRIRFGSNSGSIF